MAGHIESSSRALPTTHSVATPLPVRLDGTRRRTHILTEDTLSENFHTTQSSRLPLHLPQGAVLAAAEALEMPAQYSSSPQFGNLAGLETLPPPYPDEAGTSRGRVNSETGSSRALGSIDSRDAIFISLQMSLNAAVEARQQTGKRFAYMDDGVMAACCVQRPESRLVGFHRLESLAGAVADSSQYSSLIFCYKVMREAIRAKHGEAFELQVKFSNTFECSCCPPGHKEIASVLPPAPVTFVFIWPSERAGTSEQEVA